ncbi:MAG: hypothetical protein QXI59_07760 [Candidatus Bathyarchaeia archaeon]
MKVGPLSFLCILLVVTSTLFLYSIDPVSPQGFTHSVFVEVFSSTWSEPCKREQSLMRNIRQNRGHIVHFVVYHLQDIWSTVDSVKRATELEFNFVPSHACDGGYIRVSGAIIEWNEIESVGSRTVHLVELTVTKSINGSTLSAQVKVTERNGYSFNGEVAAYVVENDIELEGIQWDYVYRGTVLKQGIFLRPNSYIVINGNWTIPPDVSSENVEVVAIVTDRNTSGKYGSYVVQSACDKDSSAAIPEFRTILPTQIIAILTLLCIIKRSRSRVTYRVR